jgi:hypothetical protein
LVEVFDISGDDKEDNKSNDKLETLKESLFKKARIIINKGIDTLIAQNPEDNEETLRSKIESQAPIFGHDITTMIAGEMRGKSEQVRPKKRKFEDTATTKNEKSFETPKSSKPKLTTHPTPTYLVTNPSPTFPLLTPKARFSMKIAQMTQNSPKTRKQKELKNNKTDMKKQGNKEKNSLSKDG